MICPFKSCCSLEHLLSSMVKQAVPVKSWRGTVSKFEARTLCDMTEKIILSPRGSKDEGRWHILFSHLFQERSRAPFRKWSVFKEQRKDRKALACCLNGLSGSGAEVAVLLQGGLTTCVSHCSCFFKWDFWGYLWNNSLRMQPKYLNFEPLPQVMLMHIRIWKLWRDWTYALRIE